MFKNINKLISQVVLIVFLFSIPLILSCDSGNKAALPVKGEFPQVELTNYNGEEFYFKDLKGKVLVVSYIYTNCPDICHMTSKKLNKLKAEFDSNAKKEIAFVSVTFDPTRDTPQILSEHMKKMKLDTENWYFVTGRRDRVYETLEVAGINPVPDEFKSKDSYTFNHRDRISLVDRDGQIRKHYKGSEFNQQELEGDIKTLL